MRDWKPESMLDIPSIKRIFRRLVLLVPWVSLLCLEAGNCQESLLREFLEPQDTFSFERISPTDAVLKCRFEKNRFRVKSLALALPEDVTISWRFQGGKVTINTKESILPATTVVDLSNWISLKRMWLSDIPLAAIRFQKFPNPGTSPKQDKSASESLSNISEATFELHFSRSFGPPFPAEDRHFQKDPFLQIAQLLVANPEDIPGISRVIPPSSSQNNPIYRLSQKGSFCRLRITHPGIVSIAAKDLISKGFDLNLKDARYLSLFHQGRAFPLCIEHEVSGKLSENDSLWFFCPVVGSDESLESTYYLGWGESPGARIREVSSVLSVAGPDLFSVSQSGHQEPVTWDWRMAQIEEDHPDVFVSQDTLAAPVEIFWKDLRTEDDSLIIDFDLPKLVNFAEASLDIHASTALLQIRFEPPQNYRDGGKFHVILNELALADSMLPSNTTIVSIKAPASILRQRGNRVSITFRGKLPPLTDQAHGVCLDWLRVWYPGRWLEEMPLTKIPHSPLEVFPPVANLVNWRLPSKSGDWRFIQSNQKDLSLNIQYQPSTIKEDDCIGPSSSCPGDWWLVDLESSNPPDTIELCTGGSILRDDTSQADLLVITDPRYVPQLNDYLKLNQRRGYSSRIATTRQIYEEFSHGEKSVQAIRDYCTYALTHYQSPRPQYLWLVGEARWDPNNRLGSHVEDQVPSPALHTRGVIHSNDQWYVYLVGDDALPDLLVSRVSVGTTKELEAYLGKVKEDLEARQLGWWRATTLFLTDDGFSEEVETSLRNGFNQVCIPNHIRQEDYPLDPFRKFEAVGRVGKEARGIRDDVVRNWSEGARLVEYAGHGGITVWSHESLFKGLNRPDSDVDRLNNRGKYSFVTIRSCMSASVNWPTFPGEVSVSEALIKAPGRGAISVLGSSGTEFATDQERFGAQVRAGIWNHHLASIAEVRTYAQCQFLLQTPELKGVVDQFLLHGDPTLSPDFPRTLDSLKLAWHKKQDGPEVKIDWKGGIREGQGQVRFYSHDEMVFESSVFEIPQSTQSITLSVPPSLPFKPVLRMGLYLWDTTASQDAFRAIQVPPIEPNPQETLSLYHSWVKPASGVDPEISDIIISPTDPVVGESVLLTVKVSNPANDLIQVVNAEAKRGATPDTLKRIEQEIHKKGGYPLNLFPGETRKFQWLQPPSDQPTRMDYQVAIHTPGKTIIKSASAVIETPPELKILELRPHHQQEAYSASEPLVMVARVQNVGGRPTQPLRLICHEMHWNQTAVVELPALHPAQIYDATFSVIAPQNAFDWETRFDLLPMAQTSRTKWHRQSFRSEIPREINLKADTDPKVLSQLFETVDDLAPFTFRSLEPGKTTLRVSDHAQFKDSPVMNLEVLDTSDVRSATHAGVAAWQHQVGWWLSPFQLQTHPLWSGKPFKARLPWDKPPALAMIAPTYYKHDNYQFVGFPMPALTIESESCTFNLTPSNTHADGHFQPKLVELQAPGIDWTLINHRGTWPGFSGFRIAEVPEILTPVIALPEDSLWKPEINVEWIGGVPGQATGEIRWKNNGADWSQWTPIRKTTTTTGNKAQIRYWAVPDQAMKGMLIRSLQIRFEKG